MSEPFEIAMLGGEVDPTPTDQGPHRSPLDAAIAAQRTNWNGLDDLPVDEPPLDGAPESEEVADVAEETGLAEAAAPTPTPEPGTSAPTPDLAALHQELALLRSELQASRLPPAATPLPSTAPAPSGLTLEAIRAREAEVAATMFDDIEEMEAGTPEYRQARADRWAAGRAEVRQLEDQYFREQAQIREQQAYDAREQVRAQQIASMSVVDQAVARAKEAGYNVHPPGSPEHFQSADSLAFWGIGQQISQPGRTADAEIAETLKFMPPKTAPAPAATRPTRPQPMGRQGAGVPGAAAGPTANDQEYRPATIGTILGEQNRMQRIGVA